MIPLAASGAALSVAVLAGLGLGLYAGDVFASPPVLAAFVGLLALATLAYAAAVRGVLHGQGSLGLVLAIAVLLRLALVAAPPMLSSDVYRYVWDGMVQLAGISPYAHIPADPALAALRDTAIFPHINRADYAPTIYPPAAQALFLLAAGVAPTVTAMKATMVACDLVAIACLAALLRAAGLPASRVAIYAWNPLTIWEFAGNGHVDAAALAFLALALLARARLRDGAAGVAFGLAVLVKFLPAAAGPALWRRGPFWRLAGAGTAVIALLYAAHLLALGGDGQVFGFLFQYGAEEGLSTGGGIWPLALLGLFAPLPGWAASAWLGLGAAALASLALWIMTRPRPPAGSPQDVVRICADTALLGVATALVLTPHYAWYFPWLALPAAVAPSAAALWLAAAPFLLYAAPPGDHALWPSLVFAPAFLLLLRDARIRAAAPIPLPQGQMR